MAKVRYIGPTAVAVPELGHRTVRPDEVVEVPDARYDAYVCQPINWEPVEEPKESAPVKVAAKTTKGSDV